MKNEMEKTEKIIVMTIAAFAGLAAGAVIFLLLVFNNII